MTVEQLAGAGLVAEAVPSHVEAAGWGAPAPAPTITYAPAPAAPPALVDILDPELLAFVGGATVCRITRIACEAWAHWRLGARRDGWAVADGLFLGLARGRLHKNGRWRLDDAGVPLLTVPIGWHEHERGQRIARRIRRVLLATDVLAIAVEAEGWPWGRLAGVFGVLGEWPLDIERPLRVYKTPRAWLAAVAALPPGKWDGHICILDPREETASLLLLERVLVVDDAAHAETVHGWQQAARKALVAKIPKPRAPRIVKGGGK